MIQMCKGYGTPLIEKGKHVDSYMDMKDKQEAYENNINQIIDQAFEDVISKSEDGDN